MGIPLKIDRTMDNWETYLSKNAAPPIIGTVPGTAKIGLGAIQTISATGTCLFIALPARAFGHRFLLPYSGMHIKHGLGNIAAGALEAKPIIGMGLTFLRYEVRTNQSRDDVRIRTGHEDKFIPYPSLIAEDWKFIGKKPKDVQAVQAIYAQKVLEKGGDENTTPLEKYYLAKISLQEWREAEKNDTN